MNTSRKTTPRLFNTHVPLLQCLLLRFPTPLLRPSCSAGLLGTGPTPLRTPNRKKNQRGDRGHPRVKGQAGSALAVIDPEQVLPVLQQPDMSAALPPCTHRLSGDLPSAHRVGTKVDQSSIERCIRRECDPRAESRLAIRVQSVSGLPGLREADEA
jgi:hypothetical protein